MFRSLFGTTIAGEGGSNGSESGSGARSSAQQVARQSQHTSVAGADSKRKVEAADRGGFFQLDPPHVGPGEEGVVTCIERVAFSSLGRLSKGSNWYRSRNRVEDRSSMSNRPRMPDIVVICTSYSSRASIPVRTATHLQVVSTTQAAHISQPE